MSTITSNEDGSNPSTNELVHIKVTRKDIEMLENIRDNIDVNDKDAIAKTEALDTAINELQILFDEQ